MMRGKKGKEESGMDIRGLLNLQAVMFLEMAAGYFVRKRNMVGMDAKKVLTELIIGIVLPMNIIDAFMIPMSGEILRQGLMMLVISMVYQFFMTLLAGHAFRRIPRNQRMIFQYGTVCSNAGILGNTIAGSVYGELGLLYAALFVVPQRIVMWTAGVSYFTEAPDFRQVLKRVLRHPCIIAVEIGIFFMLTQISLPGFLSTAIGKIGDCTSPLTMMFLGMILAESGFSGLFTKMTAMYAVLRLLLIPAGVLFLLRLFSVDSIATGVTVVLAAMPAGSTTAIVASQYDGDVEFATSCVVSSTILSILLLPIWVKLVEILL